MSTSARMQLVLGFSAAAAAYLLLVVYNGGRIDLSGFVERLKGPAAAEATRPAGAAAPSALSLSSSGGQAQRPG